MIGYAILGLALALISIILVLGISIAAMVVMRKLGLGEYPPPTQGNNGDKRKED